MSLGEYIGSGSGTTRLLMRFNGDATDISGNDNNVSESYIIYTSNRLGKSAFFSSNSRMRVQDHSSLNIRDAITISVWLMNLATSGGAYIVSKWSVGITPEAHQYSLAISSSNRYLSFAIKSNDSQATVNDTEVFQYGVLKYVTCVYDGSALKLYVNGALKNVTNFSGQIDDPDPKSDLGIGSMINITTQYAPAKFNGYMDELIIESRAWSHSEIIKYYTNTVGRYGTI